MLSSDIIDFYLTQAPYAHADKPDSAQSIDLADYGWTGSKPLNELMQYVMLRHLRTDGSLNLFFTAANDVSSKSKEMFGDLTDFAEREYGAVLCIKRSLKLKDDNTCECQLTETYATCLFRHIRNSIAHGNYRIEGDSILLLDQASSIGTQNPSFTFVMLTTVSFMTELARLIVSGYASFLLSDEEKESIRGLSYRVPRKIVLEMED